MTAIHPLSSPSQYPASLDDKDHLRAKAVELEGLFLAEMLESAGVGKPSESFGGGAGEEAFSGFLSREYAEQIAQRGGIGLAEAIFNALASREQ